MRVPRAARHLVPTLLLGLAAAGPAAAQTVTGTGLFNTGVNGSGTALANNAVDPHWFFGPDGFSANAAGGSGTPTAGPAIVTCRDVAWVSPGAGAKWISRVEDACSRSVRGTTTFYTAFVLSGLDLSTVALSGNWSSDAQVIDVLLNGTSIGGGTFLATFSSALHPFSVGPSATSPFVNGLNFLALQFGSEPFGPGAVLVRDLLLTGRAPLPAAVAPEPATVTLLAAGLAALAGLARRRRSA